MNVKLNCMDAFKKVFPLPGGGKARGSDCVETGFKRDWARGGHAQQLRLVTVMDFAVWWNISLTTQHDGNVIKVGKVMTLIGGRQSELVLENVKREDLGAFTCLAKNSLGEASTLLILPGDFLCTSSSIICTWGNATFV